MSDKNLLEDINRLRDKVEQANKFLAALDSTENAEKWNRKYINDLPNAAFAVVEKGYSEGKDKNARHLPHHNENVKSATENSSVDLSHFRNALARVNQVKAVLGTEGDSALRKKAAAHLQKHISVLKASEAKFNPVELAIWIECEELFETNVKPLLSVKTEGGEQ